MSRNDGREPSDQAIIEHARTALLHQKRALLDALDETTTEIRALEESRRDSPELEESALRSRALAIGSRLGVRDQHEIQEIDRALAKIPASRYGRCERCDRPIPAERLEAVPATRYCVDCEHEVEREATSGGDRTVEAASEPRDHPLPPDFVDLSKQEIEAIVAEELVQNDGMASIAVRWTGREVELGGDVPSEEIGEIARQIVADRLGLPCLDATRPVAVLRELPPDVAVSDTAETGPDALDQQLTGADSLVEEPLHADDQGEPLTPPDHPIAEPRKE